VVALNVRQLTVRFDDTTVLENLDLFVGPRSSMAVLGQSGSGKSTLLRTIAGLDRPVAGNIYLDGVDVTDVHTSQRGLIFVAQSPALQPNLNLADNVERPLKWAGDTPPESRRQRVASELRRFGLGGRGHKWVNEASAGEIHSTATARGTVRNPRLLLLDEPVAALDAGARRARILELRRQHRSTGSTLVVATNDWTVAAALADRVAILAGGSIIQEAEPLDLYNRPVSMHAAELTGRWRLNRLAGTVRRPPGAQIEIVTPAGPIRTWRDPPQESMVVGIRPADLIVADDGPLQGTVVSSMVLGPTVLVTVDADGLRLEAMAPKPSPEAGSAVRMRWRRAHLFTLDGDAIDHIDSV